MRQHKLGPNGAILTCLNLFATKFDQVMSILERRAFPSEEVTLAATGEGGEGSFEVENAAGETKQISDDDNDDKNEACNDTNNKGQSTSKS